MEDKDFLEEVCITKVNVCLEGYEVDTLWLPANYWETSLEEMPAIKLVFITRTSTGYPKKITSRILKEPQCNHSITSTCWLFQPDFKEPVFGNCFFDGRFFN